MEEYFSNVYCDFNDDKDIREYSPQVLAYVGDAVYEVYVRTMVARGSNCSVSKLFRESMEYVRSKAQSDVAHKIGGMLRDEEIEVLRRGRNAKTNSMPKNAHIIEYKHATGLETLVGYLFLKRDFTRLDEILKMCVKIIKEDM